MTKERCWLFNLTGNFLPFFIPLARRLDELGLEPWWFNFWTHERLVLSLNGFSHRQLDWKRGWVQNSAPPPEARVDQWLSTDPIYFCAPPKKRQKIRHKYLLFASFFLSTTRHLIKEYPPQAVLVWNAYKFKERAMVYVCRESGIPVFFFENGFFPHTLQIDPEGINAGSSLAGRLPEDWMRHPPESEPRFYEFLKKKGKLPLIGARLPPLKTPHPVKRLCRGMKPLFSERRLYSRIPRTSNPFFFYLEQLRLKRKRASLKSTRRIELPEHFVFLPFQVHDDTQIIAHSPWVKTMGQMLKSVMKATDVLGLPRKIVVKEHPVDVGRYDYGTVERSRDVVWLRDYALGVILKRADCVITVNSSVGIEALVYGKPVVTLGEAFYNVKRLVHTALCEADLAPALSAALNQSIDPALREAFLCQLRFRELVEASWRQPTDEGVANTVRRILSLIG